MKDLDRVQEHLKQILITFIYGADVSVGISSAVADEVAVDVLPLTLMTAYISSPKNTPSLFDILQLL